MEKGKNGLGAGSCERVPNASPVARFSSLIPKSSFLPFALLSIFALLFLSGCVSNASTDTISPIFGEYWGPWYAAFYTPTMLVLFIVCLGWMYATAVRDDKLKGWCKNELLQLGFSVLILIAVLAVIATLSNAVLVIASASPATGSQADAWRLYVGVRCAPTNTAYDRPCHIRLAEDFLQILASASEEQARTVLNYNSILSTVSSIGLSFRGMPDPSGYLDISPLAGLAVPIETLGFVFDMANKNLMAIRFQQTLMELLHLAFFPLFLSMGLFFRSLYFTRRLGGLLIAIALGAYIVLPLMYVFFHAMLFSFTGPWGTPVPGDGYVETVGAQLYPISIDSSGTSNTPTQPVPTGAGYNDPAIPCAGVKGQYSANGLIEPWEECNEWSFANRTDSNCVDTGVPNTRSFGCPPRDANGNILPGREKDFSCNYQNASCTNDTTHGIGRSFRAQSVQYSASAAISDPAFPENKLGGFVVTDPARVGSRMCIPMQQTTADEEASKRLLLGAAKGYWEKIKEGFGGAFMVALAGNELLGFNGVIDNLAKIMIFSLITPFISIMVMLAGIKILSPSLGGDVDIAGLTKLI